MILTVFNGILIFSINWTSSTKYFYLVPRFSYINFWVISYFEVVFYFLNLFYFFSFYCALSCANLLFFWIKIYWDLKQIFNFVSLCTFVTKIFLIFYPIFHCALSCAFFYSLNFARTSYPLFPFFPYDRYSGCARREKNFVVIFVFELLVTFEILKS